jgi:ATP-dependent DNA ligase
MNLTSQSLCWWKYPFKPVRVTETVFGTVDLSKYVMEPKFDGFRAVLVVGKTAELWTREQRKIEMPDNLVRQLSEMGLPEGTVLDGEIWTPTKRGSWRHNRTVQCKLTFWDAIRDGYQDLSYASLEERVARLHALVDDKAQDVVTVEQVPASLAGYHEIVKEAEKFRATSQSRSGFIHGAVLKRKGSPRRDHATRCIEHPDWLKLIIASMNSGALR